MWILERQGDWCRLSPTICIRLGAFLMSSRCRLAPRVAYLSQNKSLASIFIHLYKVPCDREYKRINLIVASEHLLPFQRSEVQELRHPFRLFARWWRSIENSRSSPSFVQPQAPLFHCSEREREIIIFPSFCWHCYFDNCNGEDAGGSYFKLGLVATQAAIASCTEYLHCGHFESSSTQQ